jgi:ferritin-like metal-binding protein YciE
MHDADRIFDTSARLAHLQASVPQVEHYEMSRYGTLKHGPTSFGLDDAAELLQASLDEEEARDEALLKSRNRR